MNAIRTALQNLARQLLPAALMWALGMAPAAAAGYDADPDNLGTTVFSTGVNKLNLPELRDGKPKKMSPAEIIYWSAKENNVNPLLLLVKMQHEKDLLDPSFADSEWQTKLNGALGVTAYDHLKGGLAMRGFFPQLVAASFQFDKWRKEFSTFDEGFIKYSTLPSSTADVKKLYAQYTPRFNQITGKKYSARPDGNGEGYYDDFRDASIQPQHIQAFLDGFPTKLKDRTLFSAAAATPGVPNDPDLAVLVYTTPQATGDTNHFDACFPQCVDFVKANSGLSGRLGNAKDYARNTLTGFGALQTNGSKTRPKAGDILVWSATPGNTAYGHVALVKSVDMGRGELVRVAVNENKPWCHVAETGMRIAGDATRGYTITSPSGWTFSGWRPRLTPVPLKQTVYDPNLIPEAERQTRASFISELVSRFPAAQGQTVLDKATQLGALVNGQLSNPTAPISRLEVGVFLARVLERQKPTQWAAASAWPFPDEIVSSVDQQAIGKLRRLNVFAGEYSQENNGLLFHPNRMASQSEIDTVLARVQNIVGVVTPPPPPPPPLPGADGMKMTSEEPLDDAPFAGGASVNKRWTLTNTGSTTWNSSYCLKPVPGGVVLSNTPKCITGNVPPGGNQALTVPMVMPAAQAQAHTVRQTWRLVNAQGAVVGPDVWAQFVINGTNHSGGGNGSIKPVNPRSASYTAPLNPFDDRAHNRPYAGQCTWFAWGRAHEVTGKKLDITHGDANTWYGKTQYPKGSAARANAVAVWAGENNNSHGHVAFVEQVNGANVVITEANIRTFKTNTGTYSPYGGGYDGAPKTLTTAQMQNRGPGVGALLGYIYVGEPVQPPARDPNLVYPPERSVSRGEFVQKLLDDYPQLDRSNLEQTARQLGLIRGGLNAGVPIVRGDAAKMVARLIAATNKVLPPNPDASHYANDAELKADPEALAAANVLLAAGIARGEPHEAKGQGYEFNPLRQLSNTEAAKLDENTRVFLQGSVLKLLPPPPPPGADGMRMTSEDPKDDTPFDGGASVNKRWTLTNSGNTTWNSSYCLKPVPGGVVLSNTPKCITGTVPPGGNQALTVPMVMPAAQAQAHTVRQTWRLVNAQGAVVGPDVWAQFQVKGNQAPGELTGARAVGELRVNKPAQFDLTGTALNAASPPRVSFSDCDQARLDVASAVRAVFSCTPRTASTTARLFWKAPGTNPAEHELGRFTVLADTPVALKIQDPLNWPATVTMPNAVWSGVVNLSAAATQVQLVLTDAQGRNTPAAVVAESPARWSFRQALANPGTYQWKLTAQGAGGSDTRSGTLMVVAESPPPTVSVVSNPPATAGQPWTLQAETGTPATQVTLQIGTGTRMLMSSADQRRFSLTQTLNQPGRLDAKVRALFGNGSVQETPLVIQVAPGRVNDPPPPLAPVISNINVNPSGKPVFQFNVQPAAARATLRLQGKTFQFSCTSGTQVVCECIGAWPPVLRGSFTADIEAFDGAGRSSGVKTFQFTR